ncbi:cytochrome P450 [Catenulispora sp. GP43]|uniref:hypothetical protein n=1 Tax=Catenulispora sp. GP43 TaxID=3156263 RepID=UPI00351780E7
MVTLTSRADIEAALAGPSLVPLPAGSGPGSESEGSMAWLRATVARFAHGEVHARRRAYVETELARIDADELRRLAGGRFGDDRTRVLRSLAQAMGLPELDDTAVAALCTVADNYFGGDDPAADDAVKLLLPLMRAGDPEQAANRVGILVQACDATTALIAAARDGSGDVRATVLSAPPVQVMRRIAIAATRVGTIEIPEGEPVVLEVGPVGLAFGSGPRVCPGRALALALAEGALTEGALIEGASADSPAPAL